MGVFDSLGKFRRRQPQEETNYLSLTVTSNKVLASIWQLFGDELNFIGYSSKDFHNIDSLINEAAVAIDNAATHIKSDVSQVVFGLSYYWFEDGKITTETATILKNLSRELDLEAQAFVPISASVNHFIKLQEKEHPDVVFIGAFKDFTEISFLSGENITPKLFKGEATKENITRLLKDLKLEIKQSLPSKVIVYSQEPQILKDLEKADLKDIFNKDPKFEQFTDEDIAKCIAYSQAADVLGHDPTFGKSEPNLVDEAARVQPDQVQKEIEEPSNENQEETPPIEVIQAASAGFDFKENEDILELNKTQNTVKEAPIIEASDQDTFDNLNSDEYAVEIDKHRSGSAHAGYESPGQKIEETKNSHKNNFFDNLLTLSWLSTLTSGFSKEGKGKKLLTPIFILIALLVIVIYMVALTFSNAQVIIKANSKPLEADIDVTVASGATVDTIRSRIPGEIVSTTVSDSSETQATGSKKTGNYAKGQVTLSNWITPAKTFPKGTTFITKDGVKFTLDSDVEVPPHNEDNGKFGEATGSATATGFGPAGNISSGTDLPFSQYDNIFYQAKSASNFTGGDEKQITVVSQDDMTKLQNTLTDQLTNKAKQTLKDKNPDKQLTDDAIEIKITKKQFDKNLDEEANSLKLDMEIEATALVYDPNILKELLAKKAQEDSQDKLIATPDNIDILDLVAKRGKDTLKLSGKYRANLIPNINVDEIKDKIAGKSVKDARAIIKENPDISDIDVKFNPNLILFSSIPKNTSKINIKVEAIK